MGLPNKGYIMQYVLQMYRTTDEIFAEGGFSFLHRAKSKLNWRLADLCPTLKLVMAVIHVMKASFDYSSKYFHPRKHFVCCHIWEYFLAWNLILSQNTWGEISSELYRDWLWDGNFKFCLIFTHFSRFSPFSGYIWWNNMLSSLENFSLNSIPVFEFLMSHHDNGGFLKIAQKRDSISKKTSFCIMVINTDHQESWFLSVGHPLCALR